MRGSVFVTGTDFGTQSTKSVVLEYGGRKLSIAHRPAPIEMDELLERLGYRDAHKGTIERNGRIVVPSEGAIAVIEETAKMIGEGRYGSAHVGSAFSVQGHMTCMLKRGVEAAIRNHTSGTLVDKVARFFTGHPSNWQDKSTGDEVSRLNQIILDTRANVSLVEHRYPGPQIMARLNTSEYTEASRILLGNALPALLMTGKATFSGPGDALPTGFVNMDDFSLNQRILSMMDPRLVAKLAEPSAAHTVIGKPTAYMRSLGVNGFVSTGDQDNPMASIVAARGPKSLGLSWGTSGTLYFTSQVPIPGMSVTFGSLNEDAPYLPLVCKQNCAGVLSAVLENHEIQPDDFAQVDRALKDTEPGDGTYLCVPFFEAEITPVAPAGVRRRGYDTNDGFATDMRAAIEGTAASMYLATRDKFDPYAPFGGFKELVFIGGGANSNEISQVFANMFGMSVVRMPFTGEEAAVGAAISALTCYLRRRRLNMQASPDQLVSALLETTKPTIIKPDMKIHEQYEQKLVPAYESLEGHNL